MSREVASGLLSLAEAREILRHTLDHARGAGLMPLAVAVFDARGVLRAYEAEDGVSLGRPAIAMGKANGALMMGMGSRSLAKAAWDAPHFVQSLSHVLPGGAVPHLGGVLMRAASGEVLGAVGISGDRGDRDEAAAIAGISAAGFVPDPGAD